MKIIKRIAEEQFCFTEVHFDSIKEYEDLYPEFAGVMARIKLKAKREEAEAKKPKTTEEINEMVNSDDHIANK